MKDISFIFRILNFFHLMYVINLMVWIRKCLPCCNFPGDTLLKFSSFEMTINKHKLKIFHSMTSELAYRFLQFPYHLNFHKCIYWMCGQTFSFLVFLFFSCRLCTKFKGNHFLSSFLLMRVNPTQNYRHGQYVRVLDSQILSLGHKIIFFEDKKIR